MAPGAKYYEWEAKGIPLRIEIGPKDLDAGTLCVARRFVLDIPGEDEKAKRGRKKSFLPRAEALASIKGILDTMQKDLFQRALDGRKARTRVIRTLAEFEKFFQQDAAVGSAGPSSGIGAAGGFAWVPWAGSTEDEDALSKKYQTTIRNIPLPGQNPEGAEGEANCIVTDKPTTQWVVMAQSY
jgi:prolyl-tRNA synthetase